MANGMGSLAILLSFIYLADSIYSLVDVQHSSNNPTDSRGRHLHELSHM